MWPVSKSPASRTKQMAPCSQTLVALFCSLLCIAAHSQVIGRQYRISELCPQFVNDTLSSAPTCKTAEITFESPEGSTIIFQVPSHPTFASAFRLTSLSGNADLTVSGPNKNVTKTSAMVAGEDSVGFTLTELDNFPGEWTITVTNAAQPTKWALTVETKRAPVVLNSANKVALGSLTRCCADFSSTFPSCQSLTLWTGEPLPGIQRPMDNDLCQDVDNVCDAEGNIVKLTLRGSSSLLPDSPSAFSKCSKPPPALAQLQHLQFLDLTDNGIPWSFSDISIVASKIPELTTLILDRNFVYGELTCELFKAPAKLETLSLGNDVSISSNGATPTFLGQNRVSGQIPPCVFQSPFLKALDLRVNSIQNPLPPVPIGSSLLHLNLARQGAIDGRTTLNGRIPPDMVNARNLVHLNLYRNGLDGPIPALPRSLMHLDVSANSLTGPIPVGLGSMSNLRVLNLASNMLEGSISPGLGKLQWLEKLWLTDNKFSGNINFEWTNKYLQVLRISGTEITGGIPASLAKLPNLYTISFTRNPGLTSQAEFAAALESSNKLVWYNVSGCGITDLPDGLQKLGVFTSNYVIYDPDTLTDSYCFDVSNNNIQGPLPSWLLGPFPNQYSLATTQLVQWQRPLDSDRNRLICPQQGVTANSAYSALAKYQNADGTSCMSSPTNNTLVPVVAALQSLVDNKKLALGSPAPPPVTVKTKTTNSGKIKVGPLSLDELSAILGAAISLVIVAVLAWYLIRTCRRRKATTEGKVSTTAVLPGTGGHPVVHATPEADKDQVRVDIAEPQAQH